jgi:hypothetical protein
MILIAGHSCPGLIFHPATSVVTGGISMHLRLMFIFPRPRHEIGVHVFLTKMTPGNVPPDFISGQAASNNYSGAGSPSWRQAS